MNGSPFFSVVVPTYNRSGKTLNTLSTILNQTFKDFEVIVVDDGSTDNTFFLLQDKYKDDNRIKLLRQVNSERGAARNNGLANASGTYVIFFDSDDIMHENHLEVLHKNITEQKFPDFIATKFDFVDENNKHFKSDMSKLSQGFYDYTLFLNGNPLACNVCVKKDNPDLSRFEEDRRYSIKEDWMFLFQNMKKNKLFIVDETTISMSDHPDRSMRSGNSEIIKRTLLACQWILDKINLSAEEKKKLFAHVNYFCGIHSYLDNERKESMKFAFGAMKSGGIKLKYVTLLVKSLVGRKIVSQMK